MLLRWWSVVVVVAVVMLLSLAPESGHARTAEAATPAQPSVPWTLQRMTITANNQEVADLLRQVAGGNGLAIQVDERIRGTVSAQFAMKPVTIFDTLARSYGFFWFYDGTALIVTPVSDVKMEMLRMAPEALAQLNDTLRRLGSLDPRFPVKRDEANRLVVVNGPTRYVDMVMNIARALQDSAEQKSPTEVLVYPLKFAWADDRVDAVGGMSVPGVVTVMKRLYQLGDDRSSMGAGMSMGGTRRMGTATGGAGAERRRGGSTDRLPDGRTTTAVKEVINQALQPGGARGDSMGSGLPVIVADSRQNAVIVRDIADRLDKHRALLAQLDTRSALIEIEAQIIDVRSEAVESIGMDWRLANRRVDARFGSRNNTDPPLQYSPSLAQGAVEALMPAGGQFTVVAGNAAQFLMSRLRALESQGKARTAGTPRVTTLDNVQSFMSSKEVFYVKVPGTYSSDLFEVSAGVSLSVLPLVIRNPEGNSLRIAVQITDGVVNTGTVVDGVPSTTQSVINAEAVVREGASLLIAGYAREESSSGSNGVPVLSSMPGIGRLFRSRSENRSRFERLFLLTPRIVNP